MLVLESGGPTVLFLAKRLDYRAPESQAASLSQQIRGTCDKGPKIYRQLTPKTSRWPVGSALIIDPTPHPEHPTYGKEILCDTDR
jgi:hypothetical protein